MDKFNEEKRILKGFKLKPEYHELIESLSERLNFTQAEIIEKAIDNFVKYEMWNEGWEKRLADNFVDRIEVVKEAKKDVKAESSKFEIEKLKFEKLASHYSQLKVWAIREYANQLEGEEKKAFLKDFINLSLEEILEREIVLINGKPKLVKVENGKPVIPNVELIKCYEGWYIKNSDYCNCRRWRDCLIKKHKGLLDLDELKKQGIA